MKVLVIAARRFNGHEFWVALGVLNQRGIGFEVVSTETIIEDELTGKRTKIHRTLDDVLLEELGAEFNGVMVVSGNPQDTEAYWHDPRVKAIVENALEKELAIAGICAGVPAVRYAAKGKEVSFFPLIRSRQLLEDAGAILTTRSVSTDGLLVTAEHQMATDMWATNMCDVLEGKTPTYRLIDSLFTPTGKPRKPIEELEKLKMAWGEGTLKFEAAPKPTSDIRGINYGSEKDGKQIVYKVEEGMDTRDILCTTYQMRNFYTQLGDGFFTSLDVMNYIQHFKAAQLAKEGMTVLDVCCGRSLMLPLLRYHSKNINKYIGVDISKNNIREAMTRSGNKKLAPGEWKTYYPFECEWILSDVAEMTKFIPEDSVDYIIYTSSIEHMHKEHGYQSLKECLKVLRHDGFMLLSCPNTPGYGYDTQYPAHVYEWGYDELKEALDEVGFRVDKEVGLILGAHEMDELYKGIGGPVYALYQSLRSYIPTPFLTSIMAAPFPQQSKEILFICSRKDSVRVENFFGKGAST